MQTCRESSSASSEQEVWKKILFLYYTLLTFVKDFIFGKILKKEKKVFWKNPLEWIKSRDFQVQQSDCILFVVNLWLKFVWWPAWVCVKRIYGLPQLSSSSRGSDSWSLIGLRISPLLPIFWYVHKYKYIIGFSNINM